MLFCNVFLFRDNAIRESHLVFGHDKVKVHEQVGSIFVEMINKLIEDGGEKSANGGDGVFVEWLDPSTIHLVE